MVHHGTTNEHSILGRATWDYRWTLGGMTTLNRVLTTLSDTGTDDTRTTQQQQWPCTVITYNMMINKLAIWCRYAHKQNNISKRRENSIFPFYYIYIFSSFFASARRSCSSPSIIPFGNLMYCVCVVSSCTAVSLLLLLCTVCARFNTTRQGT